MSHSVEKHLVVSPSEYDTGIRRFVPAYEQMLAEVAGALDEWLPTTAGAAPLVLDLGAGTGALSARLASSLPHIRLVLLDADAAMLEVAGSRFAGALDRVELRHGSFTERLPACDAAVASLALHHVHSAEAKREVYRNILQALRPGGVLVNADAAVPADPALAKALMKRWAAHLVEHGDTEAQAYARFEQWAGEDRYFGIDEELELLRAAGFAAVDVRFQSGPSSVIIARRA